MVMGLASVFNNFSLCGLGVVCVRRQALALIDIHGVGLPMLSPLMMMSFIDYGNHESYALSASFWDNVHRRRFGLRAFGQVES